MSEEAYVFEGYWELVETAEELPEAEKHLVFGYNPNLDEWAKIPWRSSLWLDDGRLVGDVSPKYYNTIQYGEVLKAVGSAVEAEDGMEVKEGAVSVSSSGHKMTGYVDVEGVAEMEPAEGDVITPQIRFSTGHTGSTAVKYDLGATRQVCQNGMRSFHNKMHREQTHKKPLNYGLPRQLVRGLSEGVEEAEKKLKEARDRHFHNIDEALLVLYDFGIHRYISEHNEIDILRRSLEEEMESETPSLYDVYNSATRALTHGTRETPAYRVEEGLEVAGDLIDYRKYGIPDPEYLGSRAVERRANQLSEGEEELFEDERKAIEELVKAHGR